MSQGVLDRPVFTTTMRKTTETTVKCWEYFKCGKELVCPVVEQKADARCWIVDKTICRDGAPKDYLDKITNCRQCEYYLKRKGGIL